MAWYNINMKKSGRKVELAWEAETQTDKKSQDSLVVLWIFAVTLSGLALIFKQGIITALVPLAAAFAFYSHFKVYGGRTKITKYAITLRGFKINDMLYPFKNIRRYKITKDENGKDVLLLDMKSIFDTDPVIPLEGVNIDDVDFFLSQFVDEDPDMFIPITYTLVKRFKM